VGFEPPISLKMLEKAITGVEIFNTNFAAYNADNRGK
jgi:hypothetical protein